MNSTDVNQHDLERHRSSLVTRKVGRRFAFGPAWQSRAAVTVLVVAAIAQAVALGAPTLVADSQGQLLPVGYDLSSLTARHADGTVANLVAGRATLLLVFDPDCAHSRRVAPAWSSWLAGRESEGYRILAISPGPLADAIDFANEHHWPIEVLSVEGPAGKSWRQRPRQTDALGNRVGPRGPGRDRWSWQQPSRGGSSAPPGDEPDLRAIWSRP